MRFAFAAVAAGVAAAACAAAPVRTGSGVPKLDRVVVIVFENEEASQVIGSGRAPTLDRLARRYASLTRYYAITHPSLPNYLALVSGSTHGVHDDCTDCSVGGRSLADTLEQRGKGWKTYAEGLPRPGFTGAGAGLYAKRHVPFLYFRRVQSDVQRRERVVPLRQLRTDLAHRQLPAFSLVVPNLCHDMHDCSVRVGDNWLKRFLPPLLRSPLLRRGVVFVVFDEGTTDAGGGGRVAALAVGARVRAGARDRTRLDHYSLLRTIESALGLPHLGHAAEAKPITSIWR